MHAKAFSRLEETTVGSALCLFRGDTGALGLLNATGRQAWQDAKSSSFASLPEALRGALPALLRAAPAARSHTSGSVPLEIGAVCLDVRLRSANSRMVRLRCDDTELAVRLHAVLSPLVADSDRAAEATIEVVRGREGQFATWRDGQHSSSAVKSDEIRRRTLAEIAMALHGRERVASILHGSAIGLAGGAVVLAGRSGAGKSTLTAALVAGGGQYFGDDLIPLDGSGRKVFPFSTALSVKAGSVDLVGRWFPVVKQLPIHTLRDQQVRYLPLPLSPTPNPIAVKAVVFPHFEQGAAFSMRQVAPEECFALLVDAGSEIVGVPASARPLARLAEEVPAWQIAYGDLAAATTAIGSIGMVA